MSSYQEAGHEETSSGHLLQAPNTPPDDVHSEAPRTPQDDDDEIGTTYLHQWMSASAVTTAHINNNCIANKSFIYICIDCDLHSFSQRFLRDSL